MMTLNAGMYGFGRFGLHLLKYWLDRREASSFAVRFINDEALTIDQALEIIVADVAVDFSGYETSRDGTQLKFKSMLDGTVCKIEFTTSTLADLPWAGEPDLVLDCSGQLDRRGHAQALLTGQTRRVVLSSSSQECDATLIYGFNHEQFEPEDRLLSYGSCTVNAYLPLASFVNEQFGVINSDVTVIHNVQRHRLEDSFTLFRRDCSLEKTGPRMLPFLTSQNFAVNYTVVPYSGPSMLDFRFAVERRPALAELIEVLKNACGLAGLQGLYQVKEEDEGPAAHYGSPYSATWIATKTRVVGENCYLFGYFDTENSATRYYDLIHYIGKRVS